MEPSVDLSAQYWEKGTEEKYGKGGLGIYGESTLNDCCRGGGTVRVSPRQLKKIMTQKHNAPAE